MVDKNDNGQRPNKAPVPPHAAPAAPGTHQSPPPDESGADEHVGATEDQMAETPAPAGDDFQDEPKQG